MINVFETQQKLLEQEPDTERTQLILVDDDSWFRELVSEYLYEQCRLRTEQYASSSKFIQEYKEGDNRIILLDYDFINDVNGLTVLKHIRQVNRFASVIMLSGQDNLEAAIETLRHGAADYFVKTNKTVFANVLSSIIKLMELGRIAEN
ncbi:MAG: response regulator [Sphingobacteriales bacterium]|jgi:FixJ family two-component response regulator|nr:response regulator [Sphingobacteriales bacterium]